MSGLTKQQRTVGRTVVPISNRRQIKAAKRKIGKQIRQQAKKAIRESGDDAK